MKSYQKLMSGFSMLLLAFVLIISSCEKERFTPNTPNTDADELGLREGKGDGEVDPSAALAKLDEIPYNSIRTEGRTGTLAFDSDEAANLTITILEEADQILQAEIQSSIAGLSEEEVESMEIDDELVLESFEQRLGFSSLRSKESREMEEFLSQEELDDNNDPSDRYDYAGPDFFKAVLSELAEITVGEGISKVMPDGGNYTVVDGDLETLEFLRTNPSLEEIKKRPNIEIVDEPMEKMARTCHANRTKKLVKYTGSGNKYRAKMRLTVSNFSFLWWNHHKVYAQLKSYKKGWWIFWKKHHTNISLNIQGSVYESAYEASICPVYEYNEWTQQWELVGWEPCYVRRDCEGKRLGVNKSGSKHDWKYRLTQNFTNRISTSDMDGPSHILKGTYHWKGNTYTISMY